MKKFVIPAKAGIQKGYSEQDWIPAFAGMTGLRIPVLLLRYVTHLNAHSYHDNNTSPIQCLGEDEQVYAGEGETDCRVNSCLAQC
jgi:hypothetical protein